jgi:hypothetical protein
VRYWLVRRYRRLRASAFRPRVLLPIGGVAALAAVLLVFASPQVGYLHSVALEIVVTWSVRSSSWPSSLP